MTDTDLPPPRLTGGFDQRREVIVCVVNGCPFELPTAASLPPGLTPAESLAVASNHRRNVELALKDHLESHNVLEWVTTVRSLQVALAAAEGGDALD